jgi:4'-phosphopantetheinyl transferase
MAAQPMWNSPSIPLALTPTDLYVWQVALDQAEDDVAHLHASLSADERARADRFHFDRDRRRYIVARGRLRAIIGRYLDRAPGSLMFEYGPQGKPRLALLSGQLPLHFNVAHSHEIALYAITLAGEVGVDIEYTQRQVRDIDQIAARFFSSNEHAVYCTLPALDRRAAFLRCWTRKEAFIKAIGEGLSHPLDRFDVTLAADQPAAILYIDGEPVESNTWSLFHLEPAADYIGAVAIRGPVERLVGWVHRGEDVQ